MKIGVTGPGFAQAANAGAVRGAARAAERVGFSTLWFGEHVVLFEGEREKREAEKNRKDDAIKAHDPKRYTDHRAGKLMSDPRMPLADPIVAMSFAAAVTDRIELASGVFILPQRNPLVRAKAVATLDAFSGGRVALGVGSGWSRREYEAIGADWPGRGRRMDEYIGVLRALLRSDPASFAGETLRFEDAYMNPRPAHDVPIIVGGEAEAAMRRAALIGDGWSPTILHLEQAPAQIARLKDWARQAGRDPDALRIVKSFTLHEPLDNLARFRDAGVTEFKLTVLGELPAEEAAMEAWIETEGARFVEHAARL
jgi:probable F420-dependent oxidoreductase